MSFPIVTGIMTPRELNLVREVFREISSEDWFTRSEQRREQFALTVIDPYRRGTIAPGLLKFQCRRVAQIKFGNGASAY